MCLSINQAMKLNAHMHVCSQTSYMVYMCFCFYLCIYICRHTSMTEYMHVCIYSCISAYIHICCMYVNMYADMLKCMCMYVDICVCMHAYMNV